MALSDQLNTQKNPDSDRIDDMSYIAELHHTEGSWHQYDFLLAASKYGWDYMVDSADYMVKTELDHIGTVSRSELVGSGEKELLDEFTTAGGAIKAMESLSEEAGALGLGGRSKTLGDLVKIVWFNQTRVIRMFSPINDEDLFLRYAESMIRRSFGTPDAMKKAMPVTV